ncbi:hypothetical protein DdX_20922 [Ditylenchus destructor]|uniref:Uncharacterized protein n=1 Tax=Ditylenchus destructor TaxID=166010 RepID=A0AAD4MFJ8_9BILA|nr:hypothetical protein DdX_20922 [Ditylenchus destructor]
MNALKVNEEGRIVIDRVVRDTKKVSDDLETALSDLEKKQTPNVASLAQTAQSLSSGMVNISVFGLQNREVDTWHSQIVGNVNTIKDTLIGLKLEDVKEELQKVKTVVEAMKAKAPNFHGYTDWVVKNTNTLSENLLQNIFSFGGC